MKQMLVVAAALLVLAGCQNRVIWDDRGAAEKATTDREVWDTKGKVKQGERVIWRDADGNPVIK